MIVIREALGHEFLPALGHFISLAKLAVITIFFVDVGRLGSRELARALRLAFSRQLLSHSWPNNLLWLYSCSLWPDADGTLEIGSAAAEVWLPPSAVTYCCHLVLSTQLCC